MKQDEIIEMAKQAGYKHLPTVRLAFQGFDKVAFAKLVAAKEREACAKSLEDSAETATNFQAKVLIEWCATHIRSRGEAC
jgi:hypothetical protein